MLDLHRILGATTSAGWLLALPSLLSAGLLLSGCGQKGPLFLPADSSMAQPLALEPSNKDQSDHHNAQTER